MGTEGPPGLTGWAARMAEPMRAVWVHSELPGTEGHTGSFGGLQDQINLGGSPARAKQWALMNLGGFT